jgi:hypothetical protein
MSLTPLIPTFGTNAFINIFYKKINEIINYLNRYLTSEDQYQTTVVDISSSQILNMGTTPIELLPASGENKYYDIESIILESNQPQYDLGGVNDFIKVTMGFIELTISRELLEANGLPRVTVLRNFLVQSAWSNYPTFDTSYRPNNHDSIQTNVNMILFLTENPTNPENCNGTLRAIIKYKIKTFGE